MKRISGQLLQYFLPLLPFIVVFYASLFHPIDPDLGWHLKYGEHFFNNHSFLRENTFSSEMQDFRWVNSSWGTDLISYAAFNFGGFLGLSILGASVVSLTFYFYAKAAKLDYFDKALIFPILLYFLAPLNSVSFRGQLLSLLFGGILLFFFKEYEEGNLKKLWFVVPLFLIWSNIHGQFILGLAIFAILIFLHLVKLFVEKVKRSEILDELRFLVLIFVGCIIATVINPFGIGVYLESFKHFGGNPLQKDIIEWLPQEELSMSWWAQVIAGFMLFMGTVYTIFSEQFLSKLSSLVVWPFFVISFLVRRYVWTTYYLAIPFMAPLAVFFKPDSKKWATILGTSILTIYVTATFFVDNPFKRISHMTWQSSCAKLIGCSDGAVKFIAENNLGHNLLTFYDWGGWLIWNYPNVVPSIDGRMHLWEKDGYSAFGYYFPLEQNRADINDSKYDVVLMTPKKPMYKRLLALVHDGKWKLVYEDKNAGVFVRN